ncbi:MAG: hypothetical protein IPK08_06095 [Bacteroidetes bacterium]|nr:hypothetical protein [Bacteroidota bacterium]
MKDASCNNQTYFTPIPATANGDLSNYNWLGNAVPSNNISVPGTRLADLTDQSWSGDASPFLGNFLYLRLPVIRVLQQWQVMHCCLSHLFVVWLEMEDVYDYAISGGARKRFYNRCGYYSMDSRHC